ncbi:MAG TPA: FAD-binding oxidoreductase, partial [Anaeromyxobacteraceae bacterium]|nr:FAD-binding oxidoreductase [Anaeromyxobacteraceae bacterium]
MVPSLPASRPGTAADAVAGLVPRLVSEPRDLDEAAAALGEAARQQLAVAFVGGGTDLGLGAPPERLDAVVRTGRLDRVVEYEPADQIVVAEAGLTVAGLQAVLAKERQRLALDPPWPERATLGGVVAANAFGPLRTRHGAARDLLIGMTLVRADGQVVRAGGKVVKNVAGFDLFRLQVGALGTLALVARVAFRVHPLPEVRRTVWFPRLAPGDAWALSRLLRQAQLEPAALAAVGGAARLEAGVAFEGFEKGVADQVTRTLTLARAAGLPAEPAPEGGRAFWERHDEARRSGSFAARLSALPSRLAAVAGWAVGPLEGALAGARVVASPSLGLAEVRGEPAGEAEVVAAVGAARGALL